MEEALKYVVQVAGAGIAIVPLFATIFVINGALQGLGKFGGFISGIKGTGLKKKAQDRADYQKSLRQGNALAGKRTVGGGRYRRQYRRELRNQAADSALKSGQAQFGVTDDKAIGYVQSIAQSNAQAQAINNATNTQFAKNLATNPNAVASGMGPAKDKEEVEKALAAQQARAVAEAIKDVELSASAEIAPGDVDTMATRMAEAIRKGDSIGAQAYQNMLMRSGGPGTSAYRGAMSGIKAEELDPSTPEGQSAANAMTAAKRNLLANHGGVKETAADLIRHASDQGPKDAEGNITGPPRTMAEITADPSTWKMSNDDLVKQKTHSLQQAESTGGITQEQAREIQKDNQLYRKLDKGGQQVIDRIVMGKEVAHEEALVQNQLYDMDNRRR